MHLNKSNIIDTAKAYGRSEEMLGKLINKKFKIITKIKSLRKCKKNQLEKLIFNQVLDSIEKLKIKNIYAVLIHDTKDLKSINSNIIYQVILNLKKNGLIKKIGFSCNSLNELIYILNKYKFDIIQFPFNVFDQRLNNTKILNFLKKKKIEIHIRSIFLQGLLTFNVHKRPKKFIRWKKNFDKWDKFLASNNLSSVNACIMFVKKYNFYKKIVIGVNNSKQLKEIFKFYNNYKKNMKLNFSHLFTRNENLINPSKW